MSRNNNTISHFRALDRYAVGVGIHNAVTAFLSASAGFDVLWLSSLELSTSKLLPDANVITFTEVADTLRSVRRAVSIPIIVDMDNGYGSTETSVRAAEEFAFSGADAICIEDNAFPKRNSFYQGVERMLEDKEAFCQRISAIRSAISKGPEIIARTEGLVAGLGVEATVERARAYVASGADAIFVQTTASTIPQFKEVLNQVKNLAPIVLTPTGLPEVSAAELHEMGVDIIIFSNVVIRAIVAELNRVLGILRVAESLGAVQDQIAPLEVLFNITRAYDWLGLSVIGTQDLQEGQPT